MTSELECHTVSEKIRPKEMKNNNMAPSTNFNHQLSEKRHKISLCTFWMNAYMEKTGLFLRLVQITRKKYRSNPRERPNLLHIKPAIAQFIK